MVKNYSKKLLIIVSIFMLLSLVSISYGATTCSVTAASSKVVSGTYNFTGTITHDADFNITRCDFGTTTDGVFGNSSLGNLSTYWNQSDSSSLTNSGSTTVTMRCYNYSDEAVVSCTSTTVVIDNTDPTCSFTNDATNDIIEFGDLVTVSDGSSDTSTLTYAWTIWDTSLVSVDTSTSQNPTFDKFNGIGDYFIGLTITDQANQSTDCTNTTMTVRGTKGSEDFIDSPTSTSNNKTVFTILGILFGLILVITLVWLFISVSKKK